MTLISEEYRQEMEKLHKNPHFGVASIGYAPIVSQFINKMGVTEMLDYGAGKGNLAKHLDVDHEVEVRHYDPGVPEWSEAPDSAQLVCCIDVLEHIEPELIDDVLDDLQRVVEFYGIFTVHTGPAGKKLSDGRNAHLIQAPSRWWLPKFMERFELVSFQLQPNGFLVIVKRYGDK